MFNLHRVLWITGFTLGFTLRSVNIELVGTGANQPERQPLIRVNPQQPGCHSPSFFLKRLFLLLQFMLKNGWNRHYRKELNPQLVDPTWQFCQNNQSILWIPIKFVPRPNSLPSIGLRVIPWKMGLLLAVYTVAFSYCCCCCCSCFCVVIPLIFL